MASKYQNLPECQTMQAVDNFDKTYQIDSEQYILLIKFQKQKKYSTMYLTDCDKSFWLKKIDLQVLYELRNKLSLGTQITNFAKRLLKSIGQSSKIILNGQSADLIIDLQLGEGIIMNCTINLPTQISLETNVNGFKMVMKIFFRQLYESKEKQKKSLQDQIDQLKKQKQAKDGKNKQVSDPKYIRDIFQLEKDQNSNKKEASNLPLKHRDLLNPNKKKRKQTGAKIGADMQ